MRDKLWDLVTHFGFFAIGCVFGYAIVMFFDTPACYTDMECELRYGAE